MINNIKKTFLISIGILAFLFSKAEKGQDLYSGLCAPCHTIGQGKLIGPDLKNISEKRSKDWLIAFIQSSQTVIKSGDNDAISIYEEYNKMLMPDQILDNNQITQILNYIEGTSKNPNDEPNQGQVVDLLDNVTDEHINYGLLLFGGKKRLTQGGASCISCHNVKDDRNFSGGTLAKDLTETYEVMGSAGVAAILSSPPFPTMAATYANNPLSKEEIHNLTAYLMSVSKERYYQHPGNFNTSFVILGITTFLTLFISIIVLYFKRKRKSVNHEIHQRQSPVIN
jgi:mono/diheme cytochrome c family protein